ncbi:VOC family protein [Mucilaginibacter rubeus]|nr:VOC family protein [Mucilaginibacter rubeus]
MKERIVIFIAANQNFYALIMESLSPNIFVNDINQTISFYELLGFKVTMSVPETGTDLVWAMMTNGSVIMMFQTYDSLGEDLPDIQRTDGGSLLLYINLKNIRAFFEEIKEKVTVLKGLETTFYGATEFSIKDNNGYVLTFAEHDA